jgi:hypothetical protein
LDLFGRIWTFQRVTGKKIKKSVAAQLAFRVVARTPRIWMSFPAGRGSLIRSVRPAGISVTHISVFTQSIRNADRDDMPIATGAKMACFESRAERGYGKRSAVQRLCGA